MRRNDAPPYSWPRTSESVLVWSGRIIYGIPAAFLIIFVLGAGGRPSAILKVLAAAIILLPLLVSIRFQRAAALIMVTYGLWVLFVSARGTYWGDDTYNISRFSMFFIAPIPLVAGALVFAGAYGPAKRRKCLIRTNDSSHR